MVICLRLSNNDEKWATFRPYDQGVPSPGHPGSTHRLTRGPFACHTGRGLRPAHPVEGRAPHVPVLTQPPLRAGSSPSTSLLHARLSLPQGSRAVGPHGHCGARRPWHGALRGCGASGGSPEADTEIHGPQKARAGVGLLPTHPSQLRGTGPGRPRSPPQGADQSRRPALFPVFPMELRVVFRQTTGARPVGSGLPLCGFSGRLCPARSAPGTQAGQPLNPG